MRRLRNGFEPLETRTPPASLLGALADFFGQSDDDLFADLPQSDSVGDLQLDSVIDSQVHEPTVSVSQAKGNPTPEVAAAKGAKAAIQDTQDLVFLEGTSTLVKNSNGVSFHVSATGLVPGESYTLAPVVFNDPNTCVDGCGYGNFLAGNGDSVLAPISVRVADSNGNANFAGHLRENPAGPLTDSTASEIHGYYLDGRTCS